jgi:uncharacterized protein YcbX
MPAQLDRITIYPIKSLDGVTLSESAVLPCGALEYDRRFALLDADGRFINGKRTPAVHTIRAEFDLATMTVRLRNCDDINSSSEFSLIEQQSQLSNWFSTAFNITCVFAQNETTGFPDDTDSPGPTLVSTATLQQVTGWFPDITLDEARRRFRANLEIGGVEPFWEDRLVGPANTEVPFQIGDVHFLGINACQRCAVPARASDTGQPTPLFQKALAAKRQESLPPWAARDRFDHFYRLAVNTRQAAGQSAGRLRVGDTVSIDAG